MNYFKPFLLSGLAAGLILWITEAVGGDAASHFAVFMSLVPLAWYHLYFLAYRHRSELDQAAVDSVYYLGFLITLGCVATVASKLQPGADLRPLLLQFGLGLGATGYAVLARVHLQSLVPDVSTDDAVSAVDRAATSWREMSAATQVALSDLTTTYRDMRDVTEKLVSATRTDLAGATAAIAAEFQATINAVMTGATQEIEQARNAALSEQIAAEKRALVEVLRLSSDTAAGFTTALSETTDRLRGSEAALSQVASAGAAIGRVIDLQGSASRTLAVEVERVQQAVAGLTSDLGALASAIRRESATFDDLNSAGANELMRQLEDRERQVQEALKAFNTSLTAAAGSASSAAEIFSDGLVTAANSIVERTRRGQG